MAASFRPDIEIARGVAILFVFLFHLLPSLVPAGFLGVDIFFVLSGYLMGSVYRPAAPGDTATYLLRRARRILPAYYTVLLAIVVASALAALPHDLHEVTRHALFSAFLVPNIGFWLDGSYFDKTIFRPALHFWSLGVEIQFYLIVPVFVLLLGRSPRLLILIGIASFLACIAIVDVRPRYAFYLTPFRLWEFLLGYCTQRFLVADQAAGLRLRQWTAAALLAAVALAMLIPLAETSHPKLQAALVCVATAAMLGVGLPSGVVSSYLGRAMVMAGKYSYSIYLVHFPVIIFWFYEPFALDRRFDAGIADVAAVTALTLALSVILFHAVEAPFRKLSGAKSVLSLNAGLLAAALAAIVVAGPLQRAMTAKEVLLITDGWRDRGAERCGKFAMLLNTLAPTCTINDGLEAADGPKFLLVGDSHADSLKDALAESASEHRARLLFVRENCTLGSQGCAVDRIAEIVAAENVSAVIVHSLGVSMRVGEIGRLAALGRARGFGVIVLEPVPVWNDSVLRALYAEWAGKGRPAWLHQTLDDYRRANADLLRDLERLPEKGVARYSTAEALCRPECAFKSADGHPYYFDQGHLTITGARQLRPIFERIFKVPTAQAVTPPPR